MLKEKTLWFNFDVMWIAGSKHCGPDYMSRTKEARLDCLMGFASSSPIDEASSGEVTINETYLLDSIKNPLSVG